MRTRCWGSVKSRLAMVKGVCTIQGQDMKVREKCDLYTGLLAIIEDHLSSDDTILTLPVDPELNYLGDRRSTLWFFNS